MLDVVTQDTPAEISETRTCDVVVVGAGYAGLSTALRLGDLGVDVLVLEASARVGGRVLSEDRGGVVVDHGGQWVGPTQKRLLDLAARTGCATFPSYEDGATREVWRDGTVTDFCGTSPEEGPGVEAYDRVIAELERLARTVDQAAPWQTPDAEALDATSAGEFFADATDDPDALARLGLFVEGLWCAEPSEISLLHLLFYLAAAGGYDQLMDTGDGAQDSRFVDGAVSPARAVADLLGDRVLLDSPVSAVHDTGDGVLIEARRLTVRAERVVVAVPPPAVGRIGFEPELPDDRSRWLAASRMGRVAKVHARYDQPFWRADGLSGIATLYHEGPVGVVFDNSPADARCGVLVGFVYADRVDAWSALDDAARRGAVLADLARVVGDRALSPDDYTEQVWANDPWAHGGYEAYQGPGSWTAHGPVGWRTPCGRVHWAGTETAEEWNGYIDGAIASGERAADEVARALASAG